MKIRPYFEFENSDFGKVMIMLDQISAIEYDIKHKQIRIWTGRKGWRIQYDRLEMDNLNTETGEIETFTIADEFEMLKNYFKEGKTMNFRNFFQFSPIPE